MLYLHQDELQQGADRQKQMLYLHQDELQQGADRQKQKLWISQKTKCTGDNGESNTGPHAPKARIIPLDHYPTLLY